MRRNTKFSIFLDFRFGFIFFISELAMRSVWLFFEQRPGTMFDNGFVVYDSDFAAGRQVSFSGCRTFGLWDFDQTVS